MDSTTPSLAPSTTPLSRSNLQEHSRSTSRAPSVMRRRAETEDSEKAGRAYARDVEAAWDPCILTLDGGGIRGYSSLLIVKALMHEVWLWEKELDQEDAEHLRGLTTSPAEERLGPPSIQHGEEYGGLWRIGEDIGPGAEHGARSDAESAAAQSFETPQNLLQAGNLTASSTVRHAMSEEELLPCHYFDFMYGTSTGGLIATMLGRLRMTTSECLELYRKVGDDLFGRKRSSIPLTTKYHHEPLEKAVQDIVGSRCHEHVKCNGKTDIHPWEPETLDVALQQQPSFSVEKPRLCQSCCLTATHDSNISEAYLLRSYAHYYSDSAPNWITRYNEGADQLPIWQVTRATSAAPFYFEMVKAEVEGVEKSFKDGGIRENNPSGAALSEFHALYQGVAEMPAVLLSIGTGRPDQTQDGFASAWPGPFGHLTFVRKLMEKRAVVQNLLIKYTEGEKQHHQMREHAHGEHTWYKRLNVSDGLQDMALDDWVKGNWHGNANTPGGASLTRMETATGTYLQRDFDPLIDSYAPPSTMLRQAAEKLVRQRRAREKEGGVWWETFAGKYLHRRPDAHEANGHAS